MFLRQPVRDVNPYEPTSVRPAPAVAAALRLAGTGLGLAIVKAIAEAHDGRVLLESRLGDGTTFRVELPPLVAGTTDQLAR